MNSSTHLGSNTQLGFTPLPWQLLCHLLAIPGVYILINELTKHYFYQRAG